MATTTASRDIRVRYSSIDRCHVSRRFKTLAGAQRFAQKYVGETPEISVMFRYAVSPDGVGKVTVTGATLYELFPKLSEERDDGSRDDFVGENVLGYMQGHGAS